MCQCMLIQCWWINLCGICCGGVHEAIFCCSCWLCQPQEVKKYRQNCCILCTQFTGYGGNFLCYGSLCCAPQYIKKYSADMTVKNMND